MEASQGPVVERSEKRLTLSRLAKLNEHDQVVRALRMLVANGDLADYDDELANRVRDAIEIIEGVSRMASMRLPLHARGL